MSGKNPTRRQKAAIKQAGLDPTNWLVRKNPDGELFLVHRNTGTKRMIAI